MIADLSRGLRAVLGRPEVAHELSAAQVSFETPQDAFNPEKDTVCFCLYDLRENVELRNNTPSVRRNGNRVAYVSAPMRVDATYLVSAWSPRAEGSALREHQLLGHLLDVFTRLPVLPADLLQGRLADQVYPVRLTLFPATAAESAPLVWQALGLHLRPSLCLRATFTLEPVQGLEGAVVTQANWRFAQADLTGREAVVATSVEEECSLAGRIVDADQEAVPEATVELVEAGLHALTDTNGHYVFRRVPPGRYTMQVSKGGKKKAKQVVIAAGEEKNNGAGLDTILK